MKKIIVKNIKIPVKEKNPDLSAVEFAVRELKSAGLSDMKTENLHINKKSIDARHKNNLMYTYSVAGNFCDFDLDLKTENIETYDSEDFPDFALKVKKSEYTPVVIGFGPCGIFAAYVLALYGYNPIVFERGEDIDARVKKTDKLFSLGEIDGESNVCYGEGGAGLFSDGKLITRIKDEKIAFVIETLVKFGAPAEILYQAKPHVGTGILKNVVKNMRSEITRLGAKIYFNARLSDITPEQDFLRISVEGHGEYKTDALFLATGHSADDIYMLLKKKNISMQPKPYSMGFRIEHKQSYINEIVYGAENLKYNLPPAEYALSYRENNRGAYTFCMCPGGVVVNSSTEEGRLVTNGMSYYDRDRDNANSAVLVSFSPDDYGNISRNGIDSALEFRRNAEKKGYNLGGGKFAAPVQTLGSYLGKKAVTLGKSDITPSYTGKIKETDLNGLFPKFIDDMLKKGLSRFSLNGFLYEKAILTAPETRTSSPVRIVRNAETNASPDCGFIYPAGEGSGYAGGITSSAVDGINTVVKFMTM